MFIPCTSFSFLCIFSKQRIPNSKFCTLLENWGAKKESRIFLGAVAPWPRRIATEGAATIAIRPQINEISKLPQNISYVYEFEKQFNGHIFMKKPWCALLGIKRLDIISKNE